MVTYCLSQCRNDGTINDKCKQNNDIKITRKDILRKVSGKIFRNWPHRYGIESAPWPSDVAVGSFYRVVQSRKCVQTHLCGHDAWPTTGFHRAARFRVKNRPILHGISFLNETG